MYEFRYTNYAQQVIFGVGSLARLGEAVGRFGWRRLLLCSTGSLRRGGQITALEGALGDRLVATFERVQPHVPDFQVSEVLELAHTNDIDAVIGLGGGSSIGMAKAVSFALGEQRHNTQKRASSPLDQPLVPVVAVPTTYAGSEMTPVYGVTRHDDSLARKVTVSDPKVAPRLVLYDPLLTIGLSPEMTASTGINALAHCLEALYSITRNPLSTAAALGGIHSIASALPRCYDDGSDLEARTEMLAGAFLAGTALAHVEMALHHGLCHVLGGTAGIPHGVANSIILPHALRFNLQATAPQLAQAAPAMGMEASSRRFDVKGPELPGKNQVAAQHVVESVDALIERLELPRRLRDVGVKEVDLPQLAELALDSRAVRSNPGPITNAAQIQEILEAAW